MSLLQRIAISNGNKWRKTRANLILTCLDHSKVIHWNKKLQAEIRQKRLERLSPQVKH
jgi:hypothetical protein